MTPTAKPRMRVPAILSNASEITREVNTPETARDAKPHESASVEAFSFGDAEPVTSLRDVFYEGVYLSPNEWYEPPVPFDVLAKSYRATAHHGSALQVKRNILLRTFIPHPLLNRQTFSALALDYLVFGNCYLEEIRGRLGRLLDLQRRPAKYMRRGAETDRYFWVPDWVNKTELPAGRTIHLLEPDIDQEVYGLPDYLGSLQSAWLNESATLFRRRYYLNGSHAGFIMYVSDPAHDKKDIDAMRTALKESKGVGNFKNLFMYSPHGKKDGVQIIPVSEVAAKDEFWHIKNITRDDQLAGHRIPPQLMGIIPNNTGGFGDSEKAARVYVANELEPLQQIMLEINERVGEEVVRFRPYSLETPTPQRATSCTSPTFDLNIKPQAAAHSGGRFRLIVVQPWLVFTRAARSAPRPARALNGSKIMHSCRRADAAPVLGALGVIGGCFFMRISAFQVGYAQGVY